MSLNAEALRLMREKGLTLDDIVEIAEAMEVRRDPTAADRKRRQRERERDMSQRDVTRDICAEPPAPAPSFPPNPQTNPTHTPAEHSRSRKGTRLPGDFTVPEDWIEWAMAERGWSRTDAETEADSFCDHWRAKPGTGATKLDWAATWRNWVRNSRRVGRNGKRSTEPSGIGRTGEAGLDVFGHPGAGPR